MINRTEIETKAQDFEINPANVQRDYIFGWFLFGIFTVSNLRDSIFLKGGNALRKGYFENTRFSADLDFGIPGDVNQEVLLSEINKVCDFIQEKTQVSFVKENNKIKEKFTATDTPLPDLRVYEVRIYFKDFYGNADHLNIRISMDITRFDKVLLPLQKVKLIHPYSDAAEVVCEIQCMKLEEIIATKLKCLLQREHAPDLFDYAYSIKMVGGTLNKGEVVRALLQKTIFGRNPHILKEILLQTPLHYFKESWAKTLICAKQFLFGVEEAIAILRVDLENIFANFPDNGFHQFTYFEPKFRVPIMTAGRTQTLLKLRYDGADRIVEPYSLKYIERKDGIAREYFFAYNREGGSGQGIRTFVANKIELAENTTEKFSPQFPIEVSKAGERPENPYFFDPNRPARSPITRSKHFSSKISFGPKYIYQCGYCGKRFTKRSQSGSLGPHKNKNKYPCSGRSGYYVATKY